MNQTPSLVLVLVNSTQTIQVDNTTCAPKNVTSVTMNSNDYEINDQVWFYLVGVVGSIVGCIGLVTNSLAFGVLVTKDMRNSSSSLYLIVLAVYDWLYLLLTTVFSSVEFFYNGVTGKSDWYFLYVSPSSPVIDSIINVVLSGSTYTTVLLTIDRAVSVSCPIRWTHSSTPDRVRGAMVIVLLWSVAINLPMMLETYIGWEQDKYRNGTFLVALESGYARSYFHTEIYLKYLAPIFGSGIPVFLIAVANMVIVVTLKRRSKTVTSLGQERRRKDRMNKEANRITLQVVVVSLFTFVFHVLKVVSYILMDIHGTLYVNMCPLYCASIAAVSHLWSLINAAINLLFYCIFGQKFRRCFIQRYGCRRHGQSNTVNLLSHTNHKFQHNNNNDSSSRRSSNETTDISVHTISYNRDRPPVSSTSL